MHQIRLELTDELSDRAKRRDVEAGFDSVEEYAADLLAYDLVEDTENLDHFFTPERIAHTKAGGKTYT